MIRTCPHCRKTFTTTPSKALIARMETLRQNGLSFRQIAVQIVAEGHPGFEYQSVHYYLRSRSQRRKA